MAGITLIDREGRRFALAGTGPWRIGRQNICDVQIPDDPYCGRTQCELRLDGNKAILSPISRSPTQIDGREIQSASPLADGSLITFGQTELRVEMDSSAPHAAPRPAPRPQTIPPGPMPSPIHGSMTIGREPGADGLALDHPAVSRRHAILHGGGDPRIEDLGSTNGTYVNGERVRGSQRLAEGDSIAFGPLRFMFSGGTLREPRKAGKVAIAADAVCFDVPAKGGRKRILHGTSLRIGRGEFVCLVGGSGAGKSTLMNLLAGRRQASVGTIRVEGVDIAREFESIKQSMAFVPQREVLHEHLTVRRALGYIAELRLPSDTPRAERDAAVAQAIVDVELTQQADTEFHRLSGGQKKRACLAAEILCRPKILFLDEITSGLDEQTDFEIMQLLRRLADGGTTVVCVTHTLANIQRFCHRVVIMGSGGHLTFSGAPDDALGFFGIERLGDVFPMLTRDKAPGWAERWQQRDDGVDGDGEPATTSQFQRQRMPAGRKLAVGLHQFSVLLRRNVALLAADRGTLGLVFAQALIIGVFVGWALSDFGEGMMAITSRKTLLMLLVVSSIWMGCNGASKDIVGEAEILQREKDVNLAMGAYLAARMLVSSVFVLMQCGLLFALVYGLSEEIPGGVPQQLALTFAAGLMGVAVGLLISAASSTPSQATSIVPLVLIPQLIFIGTVVPNLPELLAGIAETAIPSNVLNAAMTAVYVENDGPIMELDFATGQRVPLETASLGGLEATVLVHYLLFVLATYGVLLFRYRSGRNA
ncbi:ATP-binding cassette domain-containing protein [Sphingomonas sanxanigenens]|uniref:ABC transporter domain-containing protein n=1 Tax=Sphingomonas sanxanigenens DSM 19645 = NX02 TaxID=1123269 RepID=W0AEF2_9SPHN|nr:FHA domain-containing protein [Sphingomonas sanxanigenens]AHE54678.1 hypothetical protein NX02_14970 [Sphingomonas sanxanigenens DSM 19645 = NX02]